MYKNGELIKNTYITSTNEVYHEQNAKLLQAIADRIKADPNLVTKVTRYMKKKNLLSDSGDDIPNAWLQYKLEGLARHKFTHMHEYYGCIFDEFGNNNTIYVYVPSIYTLMAITIPW